jgi:hypothetical protein
VIEEYETVVCEHSGITFDIKKEPEKTGPYECRYCGIEFDENGLVTKIIHND